MAYKNHRPFADGNQFDFVPTTKGQTKSRLRVNLRALFHKLLLLLFHPLLQHLFLGDALFGGVFGFCVFHLPDG
jgi:hypothetical protein